MQHNRSLHRTGSQIWRILLLVLITCGILFPPQQGVRAATTISVTPITWNVIGLDSNNVNVGPNHFPIGVRVQNTGGSTATNVTANFVWDSSNSYINIRPGTSSSLSVASLAPGASIDFYFEVEVTRNAAAYDTTRQYHINITADSGATTGSSPTPRELYVEHLISQSRNATTDVQLSTDGSSYNSVDPGGTMTLMVGETYWIKVVGSTATNGYEQIETFLSLPNTIFQILSVNTTYTAETSATMNPPYDKLYGDGCVWENDPTDPNYRSCLSTGKAGGNISVTYKVKILSIPTAPLTNPEALQSLIYDFSGSSYHYNSDYSVSTRYANIVNASIIKSFTPKTINPGGTSELKFTLTNPGSSLLTNVHFSDTFPSGMTVSGTSVAYSGCGASPSPSSLTAGGGTVSFTDIEIAALGTCTVSLTVTAGSNGTYNNTSDHLFINDTVDTGSFASDSLVVSSTPPPPSSCTTPVTLATWTMPTSGQGSGGPPPPYTTKASDVSTATASAGLTGSGSQAITGAYDGGTANHWRITDNWPQTQGAPSSGATPYFDFLLDTSKYGGVRITFDAHLDPNGGWASNANDHAYVYTSANGGAFSLASTTSIVKTTWNTVGPITATTTGTGTTRFRLMFDTASSNGVNVYLDNITFTGCQLPSVPTLSKNFSPATIAKGTNSTLTFTINNPNTTSSLSGLTFSDTLPTGLLVATPNGLSTSCSGTVTANPGTTSISWSGGTLAANTSCTISINVLGNVAGQYTNVSGNISSTETGANTTATGYGTSSLAVIAPPVIAKSFTANPIFTGNTTTLNFSIYNPNVVTTLTGVSFTDTLPSGLDVVVPVTNPSTQCGGTLTVTNNTAPTQDTIVLSGGSLAAGATCTFNVTVTGTTASSSAYTNTVTVGSTNGGTGNTATADVLVKDPAAAISLLKQVASSSSGPWKTYESLTAGNDVYYRFTVENIGDVALSSVNVADATVSAIDTALGSCTWIDGSGATISTSGASFSLPVANVSDTQLATCEIGPFTASGGTNPNTATATGTYNSTDYTDDSTATYFGTGPNLELSKTDGVTSVTAGGTTTYTLTVTNSGNVATSGTITVVDVLPTGMSIADGSVSLGGANASDWSCSSSSNVLTCTNSTSIAGSGGTSVFSFTVDVDAGASGILTNKAKVGGGGDPTNGSAPDSSSTSACTADGNPEGCALDTDTAQAPDLGLSKDDGVTSVTAGGTTTYTLTVTNSGDAVTSGTITVVDVLPSGLSIADGSVTLGGTNSGDWSCNAASNVITCTSSAVITGSGGTSVFSFTVDVDVSASGILTNKAKVGGGGDPANPDAPDSSSTSACTADGNPEGCALDTDTVQAPDLSLTKDDGVTTVNAGGTTTYTLTVTNSGNVATSGTVTVVDVLPTGMSIADGSVTLGGANAGDWSCSSSSNVLTCTSSTTIAGSGGTSAFSFTVDVSSTASGTLTNKAQVGGGGDPQTSTPTAVSAGNCSGTDAPTKGCAVDSDTVDVVDLSLGKTDGVSSVTAGGTTTYTLTVTNSGDVATSGTVTVVDVLPTGMSIADGSVSLGGANAGDWSCSSASNVITCTSSTVIAGSSGTSVFSFTVDVDAGASGTLTNKAKVGGGGDPTNGSAPNSSSTSACTADGNPEGCALDTDTTQSPDLSLTKDDGVSSVTAGGTTTYTLTVTNSGNLATSGTITVVDVLPTGMSIADGSVTLGGANAGDWSCNAASNVITCTSSTSIAGSGGTSAFSFTVNISSTASGTLTNQAQVGGGGDPTNPNAPTSTTTGQCTGGGIPNEGCAVDSDTVDVVNLGLTKDDSVSSVTAGGTTTYTLTVTNSGNLATSGMVTVVDVLPTGMSIADGSVTLGGANAGDWSCNAASNVITCTSSTSIAGSGGTSTFSFTVNVAPNASGTLTNKAKVGGGGDPTNGSAPDSSTTSVCTADGNPEGCALDSDTVTGLYDPPTAIKTFDAAGLPQLEFRMVWINSSNDFAIDAQVTDNIPNNTTYVPGSISCDPRGSSSNAATVSAPLSSSAVPNAYCGYDAANNRIQWQGTIGPDDGHLTEADAVNEVVITFRVTVNDGVNQVRNQGFARVDVDGDGDFTEETVLGTSLIGSNQVVWTRGSTANVSSLPKTGFAPNRQTSLPDQPAEKAYSTQDGLWLEIPRLGVRLPIVGVPLTADNWDVTWLWKQIGWLQGTAYPTWDGNSVLTSHVYLSDGTPGPFVNLYTLSWGDQIIVHLGGQRYIYEVRQVKEVSPDSLSPLQHEQLPWLTLITCRQYDEKTNTYRYRIFVRAVLVKVTDEINNGVQ